MYKKITYVCGIINKHSMKSMQEDSIGNFVLVHKVAMVIKRR